MLTHTNAAAVHATLKARIEKERNWTLSSCPFLKRPTKDHFEGRAWAFGKVLEWLKEETK